MSDNHTFTCSANAMLGITGKMPEYHSRLRFNGPTGAPIITLTPDGKVILSDGANVDDAARLFWAAVETMFSTDLTAARARIAELEHSLSDERSKHIETAEFLCELWDGGMKHWPDGCPQMEALAHAQRIVAKDLEQRIQDRVAWLEQELAKAR